MTVSMGSGGSYVGLSWKDSSESSIHNVINTSACTLYAPLKSSLILSKGAGDPTWSRATKAWGFNELGYLEELASGCAFFGGARLVQNLISTKSDDFSNAAWAKQGTATVTGANQLNFPAANDGIYQSIAITGAFSRTFKAQVELSGVGTVVFAIRTRGGGAGWITDSLTPMTLTATPTVYKITGTNTDAATTGVDFWIRRLSGSTATTIIANKAQLVDVTNYDASYVPEYVSVGVASAPFPSGIDGAKYFETDWQGAPIAAANLLRVRIESAAINNVRFSRNLYGSTYAELGSSSTPKVWEPSTTGSSLVTNGTFDTDLTGWTNNGSSSSSVVSGKLRIDATGGNGGRYQDLTLTVGKTYYISADATLISGSGTILLTIYGSAAFSGEVKTTWLFSSGSYGTIFKATATTQRLYLSAISALVADFDNVVVKECTCVPERTATGLDGIANTATTLTFTAADAIILQPISLASAVRCASAYVKRRTGTGTISFTQDGGSTWTDITSQINSSTWSRVQITSTLANPSVGFKGGTPNDQVDVDCVQNEAGAVATSPIVTTTATVTRNGDSLTYQTASNWSDTAGTAYIEVQPLSWVAGGAIGSATNGLLLSAANSGATASDGTNTANGPAGSPSGREKLAMQWGGGAMTVASGGVVGTAGTYDGGMGLASVGIAVNSSTYCGPVAIYNYAMTDAELQAITS